MPPIPAPESRNPGRAADGQTLNSVASEPGRAQNKWLLSLCLSQLPELLPVISIPWNSRLWHGWAHTSVAASWAGVGRHTVDEVTENQPKH